MNKMNGESLNILEENIRKMKQLFPEAFKEDKVDFERLEQILGNYVEKEDERYSFNWNGKGKAMRISQTASTGTLRPVKVESKNWDTTENLFIEGDNLEVLKLLQKSYHNKIKMIYIDPPYNTGKDFVYKDNYKDNIKNYLEYTGQVDDEGKKMGTNSETSGRYHTDWLNMMYPRLRLARNLLSDDGVIFISIDDNEVHNLRKICDEVFGEDNFVAKFIWNTEGHTDNQYHIKVNHEYVILYSKNITSLELGFVIDPNTRSESNLWKGFAENSITKNGDANPPSEVILPIGFPCKVDNAIIKSNVPDNDFYKEVQLQGYISRTITEKYKVSYPIRSSKVIVKDFELENEVKVYSGWANVNKLRLFIKNNCKPILEEDGSEISFYLSEKGVIYYYKKRNKARNIMSVLRTVGTTEQMRSELEKENIYFTYPKPKQLVQYLVEIGVLDNEGIILDFFSGSSTTAHAVMNLNAEDNGKRKFIMVQIPEPTDETSEAYKAGYKNIAEIGKERIRRAGEKILEENKDKEGIENLDIGFKVLKLDTSNIKEWNPDYDDLERTLEDMVNNFVPDRTEEDILYEIILKYGINLTLPIEEHTIEGRKVFNVGMGALFVCLDNNISLEVVEGIGELKNKLCPEITRVVFKDNGFKDDSVKTNAVLILKRLDIEEKEIMSI